MVHEPSYRELLRLFRSADIVHLQGFATIPTLLAMRSGATLVWDHHDFDLICPKSIAWWGGWCTYGPLRCTRDLARDHPLTSVIGLQVTLALRRFLAKRARASHIVHSRFVHDRNGPHAAFIIPYGIPRAMIRPPAQSRAPRVIASGRMIPEKGFDVLLRALADPRLAALGLEATLVGSGPAQDDLKALAREIGVEARTQFTGRLHGAALDVAFLGATAIVVPSIWDEPFGIVALEGMARGVPVVASQAGGLGEIAEAGGVRVPRDDPRALADALHRLVVDHDHHAEVSARGLRLANAWTWERLAADYHAVYDAALSRGGASPRPEGSRRTGAA